MKHSSEASKFLSDLLRRVIIDLRRILFVLKNAPNEGKFLEGLKAVLKKEGMEAHMDEEQTERKNKVTSMIGKHRAKTYSRRSY